MWERAVTTLKDHAEYLSYGINVIMCLLLFFAAKWVRRVREGGYPEVMERLTARSLAVPANTPPTAVAQVTLLALMLVDRTGPTASAKAP